MQYYFTRRERYTGSYYPVNGRSNSGEIRKSGGMGIGFIGGVQKEV